MLFDQASWDAGYKKGFIEGHDSGVHVGEASLRDRLLRSLALLQHDLQLHLGTIETPLQAIHEVEQIVSDRRGDAHGCRD